MSQLAFGTDELTHTLDYGRGETHTGEVERFSTLDTRGHALRCGTAGGGEVRGGRSDVEDEREEMSKAGTERKSIRVEVYIIHEYYSCKHKQADTSYI